MPKEFDLEEEKRIRETLQYAGTQMRKFRTALGFTVRSAAERAQISKNTVLRVEAGLPVQRSNWDRLRRAYSLVAIDPLTLKPSPDQIATHRIHRRESDAWYATKVDAEGNGTTVQRDDLNNEQERHRLGINNLVNHFGLPLRCRREHTKIVPFLVEIYGPTDRTEIMDGERFLYMVRGSVRVHIGEESFELHEGEAATFDNAASTWMEPLHPIGREDRAPLMLNVGWINLQD